MWLIASNIASTLPFSDAPPQQLTALLHSAEYSAAVAAHDAGAHLVIQVTMLAVPQGWLGHFFFRLSDHNQSGVVGTTPTYTDTL